MIRWNPPRQVHRLTPQFVLPRMPSHHGNTALPNPSSLGSYYLLPLRFGQQPREACKILASNATTQAAGTLAATIWDSCTIHALTLVDSLIL